MTEPRSCNQVEIRRSALLHNLSLCRQAAGMETAVLAMVKADAYGHGMVECARTLAGNGVAAFGVAEAVEGITLRKAGIREPIFILAGILPDLVGTLVTHDLTPIVLDDTWLTDLSRAATAHGRDVGVQLKVDAGMGRQGCLPDEAAGLVRQIAGLPGIHLQGIMAHFPMADDPNSENTPLVRTRFDALVQELADILPDKCCLHIANSGGLFYGTGTGLAMVRPGISLYGCPPDGGQHLRESLADGLRPVMRFCSRVTQVRRLPAGTGLGYGHIFTTSRPTTLAILPLGYEDGYLRCLSNRARVLIRGKRAPVVGRISMNLTMVDVTGIPGVRTGDEAVLLGRQGREEITADEIADWMGTISYEVLCLFGNLNHRVYLE